MKNLLKITAVAAFGIMAMSLTSCNKTYTCEVMGIDAGNYSSKDYTSAQLDALGTACKAGGGTWKAK